MRPFHDASSFLRACLGSFMSVWSVRLKIVLPITQMFAGGQGGPIISEALNPNPSPSPLPPNEDSAERQNMLSPAGSGLGLGFKAMDLRSRV